MPVKKLPKRYYILIFVLALTAGVFINGIEEEKFTIVHNSAVYAPELDAFSEEVMDEKININEADIYQLAGLDGIGEGFAERIIEYRTKNGNFEVIQDIMKVSGIGEKTFEKIKDNICVE